MRRETVGKLKNCYSALIKIFNIAHATVKESVKLSLAIFLNSLSDTISQQPSTHTLLTNTQIHYQIANKRQLH